MFNSVFHTMYVCRSPEEDTDSNSRPKVPRHMTRFERAKIESLRSFGGCAFNEVMESSKKKIARSLEVKSEKEMSADVEEGNEGEDQMEEKEKENVEVEAEVQ